MEKQSIVLIMSLLIITLSACSQQIDFSDPVNSREYITETEETNSQSKTETQDTESIGDNHDKISIKKMDDIEQFLYEQVPELNDYADYISRESEGEANLTIQINEIPIDVYKDGEGSEYLGKYYAVNVSESWKDHRVNWDSFYISVDFDQVLWKDTIRLKDSSFDMYTLEEWRNSSHYKQWVQ